MKIEETFRDAKYHPTAPLAYSTTAFTFPARIARLKAA